MPDLVDVDRVLECAECGQLSGPGASGWRAYLGDDEHAVTFCSECAKREFDTTSEVGDRGSARPAGESSTPVPGLKQRDGFLPKRRH